MYPLHFFSLCSSMLAHLALRIFAKDHIKVFLSMFMEVLPFVTGYQHFRNLNHRDAKFQLSSLTIE